MKPTVKVLYRETKTARADVKFVDFRGEEREMERVYWCVVTVVHVPVASPDTVDAYLLYLRCFTNDELGFRDTILLDADSSAAAIRAGTPITTPWFRPFSRWRNMFGLSRITNQSRLAQALDDYKALAQSVAAAGYPDLYRQYEPGPSPSLHEVLNAVKNLRAAYAARARINLYVSPED